MPHPCQRSIAHHRRVVARGSTPDGPLVRALEGTGRRAGHRVAVIARLAGADALVHVAGIVGAVVPHLADRGRAGYVLLLAAGCRPERKYDGGEETHGIPL